MNAQETFRNLISLMGSDNGCQFRVTPEQEAEALPAVEALLAAGYFADSDNDLDSSWWQAASPCDEDDVAFFNRAPDAYATLSGVLNQIFEGDLD